MHLEYRYYFSESHSIPDFLEKYSQEYPNNKVMVRLSPVSTFGDWSELTHYFWEFLKKKDAKALPPWFAVTMCGAQQELFKKEDYDGAQLYALDTMTFFGQEAQGLVDVGCPVCGVGRVLGSPPTVDERTVVSWKSGFSDKARFIIHVTKYEQMLQLGIKGCKPKPTNSRYPDHYVISLWCGNIEKNRLYLQKFSGTMPDGVLREEWGDRTLLIVPPNILYSRMFGELDSYLADLDEKEELYYSLIPPAKQLPGLPRCKWIEIEILGNAGKELHVNDYFEDAICPECGKGGFCPKGQLAINAYNWDGSDICLTETGRICLSKKAYHLMCEDWGLCAEPIRTC